MDLNKKRYFQEYVDPQGVLRKNDDANIIFQSLKDAYEKIDFSQEDLQEYLNTLKE